MNSFDFSPGTARTSSAGTALISTKSLRDHFSSRFLHAHISHGACLFLKIYMKGIIVKELRSNSGYANFSKTFLVTKDRKVMTDITYISKSSKEKQGQEVVDQMNAIQIKCNDSRKTADIDGRDSTRLFTHLNYLLTFQILPRIRMINYSARIHN